MEDNLKELSVEAFGLELREKEISKEEERIRKKREDFMDQKRKLTTTEGELRTSTATTTTPSVGSRFCGVWRDPAVSNLTSTCISTRREVDSKRPTKRVL